MLKRYLSGSNCPIAEYLIILHKIREKQGLYKTGSIRSVFAYTQESFLKINDITWQKY